MKYVRTYVRTYMFWRPWSHDDEDGDDDDDDDGDDEAADANNEKKVGNFPRPAIGACTLVDVNYVRTYVFVDGGCIVEVHVGRLELAHDQVRVHSHGVGVGHIDACRLLALHVRTYVRTSTYGG